MVSPGYVKTELSRNAITEQVKHTYYKRGFKILRLPKLIKLAPVIRYWQMSMYLVWVVRDTSILC